MDKEPVDDTAGENQQSVEDEQQDTQPLEVLNETEQQDESTQRARKSWWWDCEQDAALDPANEGKEPDGSANSEDKDESEDIDANLAAKLQDEEEDVV